MLKLGIYDNFLDEEIFDECVYYSNIYSNPIHCTETNFNKWPNSLVKDSSIIYIKVMKKCELYDRIKETIKNKLGHETINGICFTYFTQGSHIPWHDDYTYNGGLTIYLNESWDKDMGGLFMFEDVKNNDIKAVIPSRNRAIEQISGIRHSVCPTSNKSDIRKTIQIFF